MCILLLLEYYVSGHKIKESINIYNGKNDMCTAGKLGKSDLVYQIAYKRKLKFCTTLRHFD